MTIYSHHNIAVIFSARRNNNDAKGYAKAATDMTELATKQDGFIGIDNVRDDNGHGITISYWKNEAAAIAWRDNEKHRQIREKGRDIWYDEYSLHVTKIERSYDWQRNG